MSFANKMLEIVVKKLINRKKKNTIMEIGIDSFASNNFKDNDGQTIPPNQVVNELIERIIFCDQIGIDIFGIGEHYRSEFLDSAPHMILAAAAAKTNQIRLTSAVSVLSVADPVRVFQNYATLDLISNGRAEIIAGRGSFTESYPLFGFSLDDYDELFEEKLKLLLKIRKNEQISWEGKFRPLLSNQSIYPRPISNLPVWVGVGGSAKSVIRAGSLGLPLMIAIIGGETRRFRPLVDLYKQAGINAGHDASKLKVGIHSLGYVASSEKKAIDDYYPGYAEMFTKIGKERGWPPVTFEHFHTQINPNGALVVGSPEQVIEKIHRHAEALDGIARFTFQLDVAGLTHKQHLQTIELIGSKVIPGLKKIGLHT
jgi:probable LLM family oxidoreductase